MEQLAKPDIPSVEGEYETAAQAIGVTTFEASNGSVRCEDCDEYIVLNSFSDKHMGTPVIPGYSLFGIILEAHKLSGCRIGTKKDADNHGCTIRGGFF